LCIGNILEMQGFLPFQGSLPLFIEVVVKYKGNLNLSHLSC
jgi:hypothetical protein